MSKVKFILLSAESKSLYDTKLADAQSSYPGAIIFVTYTDDTDNNKQKQEIWANGTKYEVGGGAGNVIYGTDMINAEGRTYKWKTDKNGALILDKETKQPIPEETGITGSDGSIYVYTGENTQTAYYWITTASGGKWEPFNVDAENVWFPTGVLRTEPWGAATTINERPADECIGLNLKQLLEHYLVKETWPKTSTEDGATSTPDWSVNKNRVTLTVTNDGKSFTSGSYLLYGGTLKVSGAYDPELTITLATGFTSNDNGTKSKEFTLGPSQIVGLANGYLRIQDGELVGEFVKNGSTAEGETLYYKVILDSTFTQGQNLPTFKITQNIGGTTSTEKYSGTGTDHTTTLTSDLYDCRFSDLSNIKSILGTRAITATGTNSSTWRCAFYKGTKNEDDAITYQSNTVTDDSISIPGLQVAVASNKYLISKKKTESHNGTAVQLTKIKSDSSDTVTCNAIVYLPVYVYQNDTRTERTSTKYTGSRLDVFNNFPLPLAMPDNYNNWWVEIPQCANVTSFVVTTKDGSFELIGTNNILESNIDDKSFNGYNVPYKKIAFTNNAAYTTDAKITLMTIL